LDILKFGRNQLDSTRYRTIRPEPEPDF